MKIITDKGIYIQKKDLELIFKSTDNELIPSTILEKYKDNIDKKDLDFVFFETNLEIEFLNKFWFVINYNDIIDFDDIEIIDYYFKDLQDLRKIRVEHDKNKFLPENKVYDNPVEAMLDEWNYFNYLPPKSEVPNYPLDFQLLYNKVSDVKELDYFKSGTSDLELPEDVFQPIRYSKRQLQQIYWEVLCGELTFEELKPYEKQLYSIFTRIDYSPQILNIIRKIMLINRHNSVDFINDDLLDILLRVEGKDTKFETSTLWLIDYLYTIGYNKFDNFESKIVLEKDMKIIKKIIDYIASANLEDEYIEKLSKYNYVLAEIIKEVKNSNYSSSNSLVAKDIFKNMLTFVYFNPSVINNDYGFLEYAFDFVANNTLQIIKSTDYDMKITHDMKIIYANNEHFVDNFNRANSLLLYLYNSKYKKTMISNNKFLDEQCEHDNLNF